MSVRRSASAAMSTLLLALVALIPSTARAQYFGRNKVQYESFRFQVLATEHFDVYFYEEERPMAEQAARMAERWYTRLSTAFDHELRGRQPLILYASHPHFEQTNAVPGELDESTGGVTESFKRRIVLPLAASVGETDHVIGHELVHAFQFDLRRRGQSNLTDTGLQLPLWFVEGMAEYLSIGPEDAHTAMWMRDAVRSGKFPTISKLGHWRYFPYRFGHALWAYVAARWGEARVGEIFKLAAARGMTPERAFEAVLGVSADSLSKEWRRQTADWAAQTTQGVDGSRAGRLVLGPRGERGRLNVSPSLSPDGRLVAFLSERDAFSIELFLAEASTGKVVRRLTKAAVDPHLQSLQFIHSAGAFSPDGRRIAIATVRRGQPTLAVIDVGNGRNLQQIRFGDLGEITHPTWSPDGRRVAFSGLVGGSSDLFVVDLATQRHERLTHDLYADLQPAWSPDGRSIAFATDRFTTDIDDLRPGSLRLALWDLDARGARPVEGAESGKHINPQWSRDGRELYFVSDRGGAPNVYRLRLGAGQVSQVTDLATGVSGITGLSPALSVARDAERAIFSVFEEGSYRLHLMEGAEALAGRAPRAAPPLATTLPTALGSAGATATQSVALADISSFRRSRYRAGLSLDSVGQVGLGVAAGSGGVAVGGGSALYWSDMLGDHNLATQFQISSAEGGITNNLGAILAYANLKKRWNWAVQASQVPYFSRSLELEDLGGDVGRIRDTRFWEVDRQFQGVLAYPMSRAQRAEVGAGFRSIDFKSEVQTQTFYISTGQLLTDVTEPGPEDTIPSLNLFQGMAALVYDNSIFSGTSPVVGQRYRFELAPTLGDLQFMNILGDYRRYQRLGGGPFTLAGRGLHLGRYGPDSETDRIAPLFIGYPWIIRGYDAPSFTLAECEGGSEEDCPAFDRLFGSRMAVGNLELRLPVLGALGAFPTAGVPPVEAAAFFDAGVAWSESDEASFLGGDRHGVTSHGATLRINLLGFAVAEIAYVHPNQRPVKGWYWLFSLQPGF